MTGKNNDISFFRWLFKDIPFMIKIIKRFKFLFFGCALGIFIVFFASYFFYDYLDYFGTVSIILAVMSALYQYYYDEYKYNKEVD